MAAQAISYGYRGAASFNFAIYNPDLGPVNEELRALGMPELDDPLLLYGAQGFAHLSDPLRVGVTVLTGGNSVETLSGGVAREASFNLTLLGLLIEYRFLDIPRFEAYAGASVGAGWASVRLERNTSPVGWDDVWGQFQPAPSDSATNLTAEMEQRFFWPQPRVGARFYPATWLAISGSVEVPLVKLGADNWMINGNDLYGAQELDLISPFFQFSLSVGI